LWVFLKQVNRQGMVVTLPLLMRTTASAARTYPNKW